MISKWYPTESLGKYDGIRIEIEQTALNLTNSGISRSLLL